MAEQNDFTLVVGVDEVHLKQLELVYPTWAKHKPSLLDRPMIIFYDRDQVSNQMLRSIPHPRLTTVAWPPPGAKFEGGSGKFENAQRYKMLAGFVHVPAVFVNTPYWLKLDTDVVATGQDDWVDPSWFTLNPAIVAHKWSFTKPPDQMQKLDDWADNVPSLAHYPRLNLKAPTGATRLGHRRIISCIGFFSRAHTMKCSGLAAHRTELHHLPVPSQDGFMWYVAARTGAGIVRINAKARGWEHWSTRRNIEDAVERAMHA